MCPKPIHVLHLINSLGRGGAEKRLTEILERLPRDRFAFDVCCLSAGGAFEERVRAAGASVEILGYRGLRRRGKPSLARLRELRRMIRRFRRTVERLRPDVVQTWIPICNYIGGRALAPSRFEGVRLIASRVFTGEYRDGRPLMRLGENRAARRADWIYCNCEAVRDDTLRREPKLDPAIVRVIRNGVDLERFAPRPGRAALRQDLGLGEQDLAIVVVAALRPHKGHADLLAAAKRVVSEHPAARFLLVGPDQGEGPRLLHIARNEGISHAIKLIGPRDDTAEILAASDVLALPSLAEGLPNVLLEAQAAGLPCVATSLPGCIEAVEHDITGLLTPPGNPDALAAAIGQLLGDPDLRQEMGRAGRRRAEKEFPLEAMFEGFAKLYR
jgi:glycosyltransferase involved in cell wall biosynthesis